MRLRLASMIAAMCLATPVVAGDGYGTKPANWTGCYVGVQAGYGATHHDTSLNVVAPGVLGGINGSALDLPLSSQGGNIGLHAGCDMQVQQLVFGAFGDYNWLSQSMEVKSPLLGTIPGGAALNPLAKIDLDTMWTVGGRAGLLVSPSTLVYGLVGWSRMDTSDLTVLGTTGGSFTVPTLEGWTFGGGVSVEIAQNIRLGAEYRYTRFDRVDIPLFAAGGNSIGLGIQPDMHTAMARLSYRFAIPGMN